MDFLKIDKIIGYLLSIMIKIVYIIYNIYINVCVLGSKQTVVLRTTRFFSKVPVYRNLCPLDPFFGFFNGISFYLLLYAIFSISSLRGDSSTMIKGIRF